MSGKTIKDIISENNQKADPASVTDAPESITDQGPIDPADILNAPPEAPGEAGELTMKELPGRYVRLAADTMFWSVDRGVLELNIKNTIGEIPENLSDHQYDIILKSIKRGTIELTESKKDDREFIVTDLTWSEDRNLAYLLVDQTDEEDFTKLVHLEKRGSVLEAAKSLESGGKKRSSYIKIIEDQLKTISASK